VTRLPAWRKHGRPALPAIPRPGSASAAPGN